jgi:ABC-type bacteriocin/lantibiotic exporter with double-glycine peptidase domain
LYCVLPQCGITIIVVIILGAAVYASNLTGYGICIAIAISIINYIDTRLARKQRTANMNAMTEVSSLILQVFKGKHNVTIMQLEPFFLEKFTEVHNAAFL